MTFDSKLLKPGRPQHPFRSAFSDAAEPAPGTGSDDAAAPQASSVRDIEQQCLRVLRCTAKALAASDGGLRFTPGARAWLYGLSPMATGLPRLGVAGRHASSPAPHR